MVLLLILLWLSNGVPVAVTDTPGTLAGQLVIVALVVLNIVQRYLDRKWEREDRERKATELKEKQEEEAAALARRQDETAQALAAKTDAVAQVLGAKLEQNTAMTATVERRINGGLLSDIRRTVAEVTDAHLCEKLRESLQAEMQSPTVVGLVKQALHEELKNPRAANHFVRNILHNKALWEEAAKIVQQEPPKPGGDAPPGTPGDRPGAGGAGDDKPAGGDAAPKA